MLNRKPVEELLERAILSLDTITGAKHLKQLCLGDFVDFRRMHSRLQFKAGDTGGVKVVVVDDNWWVSRLFTVVLFSPTVFSSLSAVIVSVRTLRALISVCLQLFFWSSCS